MFLVVNSFVFTLYLLHVFIITLLLIYEVFICCKLRFNDLMLNLWYLSCEILQINSPNLIIEFKVLYFLIFVTFVQEVVTIKSFIGSKRLVIFMVKIIDIKKKEYFLFKPY